MTYLIDTNVLTRSAQPGHAMHAAATGAVAALLKQDEELVVVPQVLYEFWVVCTRPLAQNGLGFSIDQTTAEFANLLIQFPLIHDTAAIFSAWRGLVTGLGVSGKEAHDTRLIAAMMIHGILQILTFNSADFQRYPGITAVTPDEIIKA